MSIFRRTIFLAVLTSLAGTLGAQSFLEQYGFGQVQPEADVVGQGMGGITVLPMGLRNAHFSLPASWHRARRTKLQIGLVHNGIEVDGGGSFSRDALQHFQFLAHLTNRAAIGVVLRPLTRVDISFLDTTGTIIIGDNNLAYDQHRTVSGGQSALAVGYSRRINSRLSLGLALDVIFGTMTQADTLNIFAASDRGGDLFGRLVAQQRHEFTGKVIALSLLADQVGIASGLLGIQLRLPLDLTIVNHSSNSSVRAGSQSRRLEAGLPLEARLGYGFSPAPDHLLAAELGWSAVAKPDSIDLVFGNHIEKTYDLRLGWSKVPVGAEKLEPARLYYRVGFYYRRYYISRSDNESLGEIGLTAGLGYRSLRPGHRVDLALQVGRRAAPAGIGEERFVSLSLGVTTGELWFLRPKKKWD
ncbi:MAG: hypothetical protein IH972_05205 [Candidatus Marinimicrobia bacterium]|nr:hypothetical protein [Candidatus Neomarinimicrobiota bacterium]